MNASSQGGSFWKMITLRPRLLMAVCGLAWSLTCLSGCGSAEYEERLKSTEEFYRRMNFLDDNLYKAWNEGKLTLRIPKPFAQIPAPQRPEGEENKSAPLFDERQPKFLNLEFPGLKGAWKCELTVEDDARRPITREAFIYVLSNVDYGLDPKTETKIATFDEDLVSMIANALRVRPEEVWQDANFPRTAVRFFQQKSVKHKLLSSPSPFPGSITDFYFYAMTQGDVKVVVLFVYPKDATKEYSDRRDLSMETLEIPSEINRTVPQSQPNPSGTSSGF